LFYRSNNVGDGPTGLAQILVPHIVSRMSVELVSDIWICQWNKLKRRVLNSIPRGRHFRVVGSSSPEPGLAVRATPHDTAPATTTTGNMAVTAHHPMQSKPIYSRFACFSVDIPLIPGRAFAGETPTSGNLNPPNRHHVILSAPPSDVQLPHVSSHSNSLASSHLNVARSGDLFFTLLARPGHPFV